MSEQIKPDSDGQMIEQIKDWQTRMKELAKPENFHVSVLMEHVLANNLTPTEYQRMIRKLSLVSRWATNMAIGMLKGTVKYPNDDWTLDQWFSSMLGEGADFANYLILQCANYEQMKAEQAKNAKEAEELLQFGKL